MKGIFLVIILAIGLSGCTTIENWSDKEKQTAMIVAGVLVGAIIIAEAQGDDIFNELKEECRALPHGVCNP